MLCENVAGLINLGLDQVLSDLESENYTVQTFNIPACAVNAPHRRDRLWIVAHSKYFGQTHSEYEGQPRHQKGLLEGSGIETKDVAHSECQRQQGQGEPERSCNTEENSSRETSWFDDGCKGWEGHWDVEPSVGRVAHGVPGRVDRLKQLGNAVVPQVVEQIGRAIMEIEAMTDSNKNEY